MGLRWEILTALAAVEYEPPPAYHVPLIDVDGVRNQVPLALSQKRTTAPPSLIPKLVKTGEDDAHRLDPVSALRSPHEGNVMRALSQEVQI